MRVSIDLHGVIDKDPKGFNEYAKELMEDGHEVFVLTGSMYIDAISELIECGFNLKYATEIISVTDYLLDRDLPWEYDKHHRPSFNEIVWWGAKAQLARNLEIDFHIDDTLKHLATFTTPYMIYGEENIIIPWQG